MGTEALCLLCCPALKVQWIFCTQRMKLLPYLDKNNNTHTGSTTTSSIYYEWKLKITSCLSTLKREMRTLKMRQICITSDRQQCSQWWAWNRLTNFHRWISSSSENSCWFRVLHSSQMMLTWKHWGCNISAASMMWILKSKYNHYYKYWSHTRKCILLKITLCPYLVHMMHVLVLCPQLQHSPVMEQEGRLLISSDLYLCSTLMFWG